ncbi:GNAT family N-acetyltransferase [Pseudonocardia xinjiangensis]|uniref:GNAT family N-acetyltransferase n=1 Tax=Pseudonocardia xinjiangensis TaxID=75289 RepID=UPI0028AE3738|nr:GNAT family N-acetyltransferase [Pseudonocardia xinjiangensis]
MVLPVVVEHVLDNAVWAALTGAHADLAERRGRAARYRPDVSPFAALPSEPGEGDWADLAAIVGPSGEIVITGRPRTPPSGWEVLGAGEGVQMEGSALEVRPDPEAVLLGAADVPEMLDLVARTRPGPFEPNTRLMGTYLGIRDGGALVAMAGERVRPPGWSEISAVCTDPAYQGRGLASRLLRAVGAVIRERGDVPFLHAAGSNATAIRLYEHLGFTLRRRVQFAALRTPASVAAKPLSRNEVA